MIPDVLCRWFKPASKAISTVFEFIIKWNANPYKFGSPHSLMHLPLVQMLPPRTKKLFKFSSWLPPFSCHWLWKLTASPAASWHISANLLVSKHWHSHTIAFSVLVPILIAHDRLSVALLSIRFLKFQFECFVVFPATAPPVVAVPTIQWLEPILFYSCHRHLICLFLTAAVLVVVVFFIALEKS